MKKIYFCLGIFSFIFLIFSIVFTSFDSLSYSSFLDNDLSIDDIDVPYISKNTNFSKLDTNNNFKENIVGKEEHLNVFVYNIVYGDTLWDLSISNNTNVDYLVYLNDIPNRDLIYAGSTLYIPNK